MEESMERLFVDGGSHPKVISRWRKSSKGFTGIRAHIRLICVVFYFSVMSPLLNCGTGNNHPSIPAWKTLSFFSYLAGINMRSKG
jgi:hypothetical protein